jgi:hypothetical protein
MAFQRPSEWWFDQIDNIKDGEWLKWIYVPPQLKLDGIDAYIQMPILKTILRILQLMNSWEVSLSLVFHMMKNRSGIPAHKLISGRKRICLKVSKSQNNSRKNWKWCSNYRRLLLV